LIINNYFVSAASTKKKLYQPVNVIILYAQSDGSLVFKLYTREPVWHLVVLLSLSHGA